MKRENKYIDRIFQEKFKDFEASPNATLWSKIEAQLDAKQPPKVLPLWFKVASVAASLVVLVLGWNFYQTSISSTNTVVNQEINLDVINDTEELNQTSSNLPVAVQESEENIDIAVPFVESKTESTSSTNLRIANQNQYLRATKEVETPSVLEDKKTATFIAQSNPRADLNKQVATPNEANLVKESMFTSQVALVKENLHKESSLLEDSATTLYGMSATKEQQLTEEQAKQELIHGTSKANQEELIVLENTTLTSAEGGVWSIKPQVSPVFNLAGNSGASVDPMLTNNTSQGNTSLSYGMLVTYQVANNLRIRSGVQQVTMAYTTNNVVLAPSVAGIASNQINFNTSANGFNVFNELIYDENVTNPNARVFAATGNLQQQLGFVEVPMEVEWQLLEGKFGVYASGGASTLFLVQNSIGFRSETGLWDIGENAAANAASFSGNLGLGLEYQLSRRFNLNLEPSLRYQFNTFTNQVDGFTPYFFAIYSGVNFKF